MCVLGVSFWSTTANLVQGDSRGKGQRSEGGHSALAQGLPSCPQGVSSWVQLEEIQLSLWGCACRLEVNNVRGPSTASASQWVTEMEGQGGLPADLCV